MFKQEKYYLAAVMICILLITVFLKYIMPPEWVNTPEAMAYVKLMAGIIPAIHILQKYSHSYTPYWGFFFAVQWTMVPVSFVMGFIGAKFLSEYRFQILVMQTSSKRLIFMGLVMLIAGLGALFIPTFASQVSQLFLPLVISWIAGVGLCYYWGQLIRVFILKHQITDRGIQS